MVPNETQHANMTNSSAADSKVCRDDDPDCIAMRDTKSTTEYVVTAKANGTDLTHCIGALYHNF